MSRATVYYQFKSKQGLLDAALEEAQHRGGLEDVLLVSRFPPPPPSAIWSLREFIAAWCRLWDQDRDFYRGVMGLARVDPQLRELIKSHEDKRVKAARMIAEAVATRYQPRRTADGLLALTSFETFDRLRESSRALDEVIEISCRMAESLVDAEQLAGWTQEQAEA